MTAGLGVMARSEELTELLNRKAGIADDSAKGEGVDRVVTWDGQNSAAVRHDDMLALTHDHKAGFLEGAHGIEMVDAWNLRQG